MKKPTFEDYVQLIIDTRIRKMKTKEHEEDIATIMMEMLGRLYFHMANEMLKLGEEGEAALRRAVRAYGRDRGLRLRRIHRGKGLPINVRTLFEFPDLPGVETSHFRRTQFKLDENTRQSETYECHFHKVWKELGGEQALRTLGQIYCVELHPAMWGAYDPDITVELPQLLTKGDPHCRFEVHR